MKTTVKSGALTERNAAMQGRPAQERFSDFLAKKETQSWIENVVGDKKDRFISSLVSAVSSNPQLQQCDRNSVISAALLANTLDMSLSPQLGLCYLVPYKNREKVDKYGNIKPEHYTAQFMLGYKGYIQLAIRSGNYKNINVLSIKEGELKSYNPLTEDLKIEIIEDDELREKTPTKGYFAFFRLTNGFEKSLYWSKEKMLHHADRFSPAFKASVYKAIQEGKIKEADMWKYSSFWYKDFDGMAYKTMIRQLLSKWGLVSIDLQMAFENDEKDEVTATADSPSFGDFAYDDDMSGLNEVSEDIPEEEDTDFPSAEDDRTVSREQNDTADTTATRTTAEKPAPKTRKKPAVAANTETAEANPSAEDSE